jgi:hypothetical protein
LDHFVDLALVFGEALERPSEFVFAECLRRRPADSAPEGLEQFGRNFVDRNSASTTAPDFARIPQCAFATRTANLTDLAR